MDPKIEPFSKMPHIGPENIESRTGRLTALKSAEATGLISGKYLFASGDVLYSKIRPYLQKAALPNFSGICSADMYALHPQSRLTREFLFCWLLSEPFTAQVVSHQSRTGIPKVNRQQLNSTLMAVPPLAEQHSIASYLLSVDQSLTVSQARVRVLQILFQSLLHHLMTGKLRVHDLPLAEPAGSH